MSTSGSYNPPGVPECAYEPEMTHAEALARRDAGTLDPNCVVVITDGPVIGTPGNTSPTMIELNPVTPSDIGRTARIHTNFDNVAFAGLYNIDDGPNGSINSITDHWNNQISDEDPGAPTVHTQFPYHLSGPDLRDNRVNDCTLTGWDTAINAGTIIWDNDLLESGIHLAGMAGDSQFIRNGVRGAQITVSSPNMRFNGNDINNAPVTFASTSAAIQSFQENQAWGSPVTITGSVASAVVFNSNRLTDGYEVTVTNKPSAPVTISGNILTGTKNTAIAELFVSGTGVVTCNRNQILAGTLSLDNAGNSTVTDNNMTDTSINKAGTGAVSVSRNTLTQGTFTQGTTSTASLTMTDNTLTLATVDLTSTSSNAVQISNGNYGRVNMVHNGSGFISMFANQGAPSLTTSAASTRNTTLNSNTGRFVVNQNGTGSTGTDTIIGSFVQDGTVNFNSTLAGTGGNSLSGVIDGQSIVNVADGASPNCMTQTRVGGFSTLNIEPGGNVSRCRFDANITVNTGPFAHINSIAEGAFVLSPTAANNNSLLNAAFSNWT